MLTDNAAVTTFLQQWSERMNAAGYLQHTTAKREDCIQSLHGFLHPVVQRMQQQPPPSFEELIRNEEHWADALVQSARRHRLRGITPAMFLGCFKTLVRSVHHVIDLLEAEAGVKSDVHRLTQLFADAFEVIFVEDWATSVSELSTRQHDEANRLLTLEKCRFENILNTTSDLVLVVDNNGTVTNCNMPLRDKAGSTTIIGTHLWDVLGLEGQSMEDILRYYPLGLSCEIIPFRHDSSVYRMQVTPLSTVSLASDEYLVMLTNITQHAQQRETLETIVEKQTNALRQEKLHLEEMNVTLRNVLHSIERERSDILKEISAQIQTMVMPALNKLETENDSTLRAGYAAVARDQLLHLGNSADNAINPLLLKLTHSELRVCQFIQAGNSTKDIAQQLNLSVETIQTHRKNIRRKLGLHGKGNNLFAYLRANPINTQNG